MTWRLPVVAMLGSGAAMAAGCGSSSSVDPSTITDAATKTALVGTYAVSLSSTVKPPGASQSATLSATGGFDVPRHRGHLALDFTPLTELTGRNLGTMLLVLDGQALYVKLPYLRVLSPQLKPWLKMTLDQSARAKGLDLGSILQLAQGGNPTQFFDLLRGADHVKKLGRVHVLGVKTTHYSATIDLAKAERKAPPRARAGVKRVVLRLEAVTHEEKLPAEIWLDPKGRARHVKYTEHVTFGGKRTKVVLAADYYDFGTRVVVPVPLADQVTDLTTLTGPGGGV